jgi:multidrug efflux pump subunit AcrA (membrane-fusion protein)
MAQEQRQQRDAVEQLQAEFRKAKDELTRCRAEVARLEKTSAQGAALSAARSRARDADAAFQRALDQLERSRRERTLALASSSKSGREPSGSPLGNDGVRPDTLEQKIRFAVGFGVGGFSGFYWAARWGLTSGWLTLGLILASGVGTGLLARWYGDRYWTGE